VLEAATPLAKDDPECAAIVLDALAREGVTIRSGVKVAQVRAVADGIALVATGDAGDETITGSHLLVATGRRPTVDGLDLQTARIKFDRDGIKVDRRLRTSNPRVFAIGDVTGRAALTHAANYDAGIVIRNALFRWPAKVSDAAIPWVTYTDPELAQAGLSEVQARARGYKLRILRWPYHDNDRAQAERRTHGHIKVITTRRGRILGTTIVGAEAGELITIWALAIAQKLSIRTLTNVVVPYPTLSEVGKRAAIDFFAPDLTRPWVRRIIAMLRVFG
jgi:pyruvate/2-oxoglutarate dehydrogenase complex dihydrolipoamide dehydrogenase (E3) component